MTRFVAFPDLHTRAEKLKTIRHVLADVDVVLLPGDMTNGTPDDLHRILNIIEPYNERILAVCGNMDTEKMNMWMSRNGISIHRRHEIIDHIAILGCGGALPFYGQYVFSEEQLAGFLNDTLQGVPDDMPKVLVCHQPPYDTTLDVPGRKPDEHVGSKAVREFVERVQPLVMFTGHMHSATGIDSIGNTQIINPGPLWESNQYAFCEIINGEVTALEIREVEPLDL